MKPPTPEAPPKPVQGCGESLFCILADFRRIFAFAMTNGVDDDEEAVRRAARRLWERHDSAALMEAERLAEEAPGETWERRWWMAVADELRRQFFGAS